jgi:hypothetical protein
MLFKKLIECGLQSGPVERTLYFESARQVVRKAFAILELSDDPHPVLRL